MEKILFVTDATQLNTVALDFAAYLCKLPKAKLVGIFLQNSVGEETACNENIQHFMSVCESSEISCSVLRKHGIPHSEVIRESLYADCMLLDAETSFVSGREDIPTDFVKKVLAGAQCPVIITPVAFEGIESLAFTYDGQAASISAIKQFTYLFPEYREIPVEVISVNIESLANPDDRYRFKEWLHMHYTKINFITTEGNVKAGLTELLIRKSRCFIIMGAYGRSKTSQMINSSHASPVIQFISQPVFISHH